MVTVRMFLDLPDKYVSLKRILQSESITIPDEEFIKDGTKAVQERLDQWVDNMRGGFRLRAKAQDGSLQPPRGVLSRRWREKIAKHVKPETPSISQLPKREVILIVQGIKSGVARSRRSELVLRTRRRKFYVMPSRFGARVIIRDNKGRFVKGKNQELKLVKALRKK